MLNQDFKEFIQFLNDNHVRYLVVGGYAVAVHGHPRFGYPPIRLEVNIDNILVNFIDLDNLRKNKEASGRLQDLADLENLN